MALTECGNVPDISKQWDAGAKWLFFMPWYDYGRTNNPNSADFKSTSHNNCNAAWWNKAFSNDFVLTRDDMKALRQDAAGISFIPSHDERGKSGVVYDLSGRRVTTPRHGIYIINGRKLLIK